MGGGVAFASGPRLITAPRTSMWNSLLNIAVPDTHSLPMYCAVPGVMVEIQTNQFGIGE